MKKFLFACFATLLLTGCGLADRISDRISGDDYYDDDDDRYESDYGRSGRFKHDFDIKWAYRGKTFRASNGAWISFDMDGYTARSGDMVFTYIEAEVITPTRGALYLNGPSGEVELDIFDSNGSILIREPYTGRIFK